jgi:ubiquitin-protein ligase
MTLSRYLMQVRTLLNAPNPADPLMPEIGLEYTHNRKEFNRKAK